jgi:hypothetical protein
MANAKHPDNRALRVEPHTNRSRAQTVFLRIDALPPLDIPGTGLCEALDGVSSLL